jgi:hypothetical protein
MVEFKIERRWRVQSSSAADRGLATQQKDNLIMFTEEPCLQAEERVSVKNSQPDVFM